MPSGTVQWLRSREYRRARVPEHENWFPAARPPACVDHNEERLLVVGERCITMIFKFKRSAHCTSSILLVAAFCVQLAAVYRCTRLVSGGACTCSRTNFCPSTRCCSLPPRDKPRTRLWARGKAARRDDGTYIKTMGLSEHMHTH